jgi:pimeloyl-ACP methyl ester carboxylesterase
MERIVMRIALAGLALTLGACGGDTSTRSPAPSAAPSSSATVAQPTVTETNGSTRQISVTAEGRRLAGHCAGERPAGSPAVILESGMGGDQAALQPIEESLVSRTTVCAYDRAGVGQSDPAPTTPRTLAHLVSDLHAFLAGARIDPPYLLVGQSMGANVVFMYAQAYPGEVAGFVSMNPVPPYTRWIRAARKVETKTELHDNELVFYQGQNDERIAFQSTDKMLEDPLPDSLPYTVMFAEDCGGDTEFCGRVLEPLAATTKALGDVGQKGSFVRVKDAGHEIVVSNLDAVLQAIDGVSPPG